MFDHGFALKVRNRSWIGSVQRAVATWSVISTRHFLMIRDSYGLTRSLPLPVLTRSKRGVRLLGKVFDHSTCAAILQKNRRVIALQAEACTVIKRVSLGIALVYKETNCSRTPE